MPKRRAKKTVKQPSPPPTEPSIIHQKAEGLVAAIISNTDVETERLLTSLRLLRSCFSPEQLRTPAVHIFKDNLPNLSIHQSGENGAFEVRWNDGNRNIRDLNASLLRGLSSVYPQWKGFEFSGGVGPKSVFGSDDLQVMEGLSDSQMMGMQGGLRTPAVSGQRLSIGMTPKTIRLPNPGEMILSVRGSPLGVYKDENMEAIHESEEG